MELRAETLAPLRKSLEQPFPGPAEIFGVSADKPPPLPHLLLLSETEGWPCLLPSHEFSLQLKDVPSPPLPG